MSEGKAIVAEGVSKKFARGLGYSMRYGVNDIFFDLVGISTKPDRLRKQEFWAVRDVSFDLKPGDTLGIIGPNGSGKSTLLKILNGIMRPDQGRLEISGRTGALIDVGAGFHPALTGRENIFVSGAIQGMSRSEIKKKYDSIVDFAEIGDFINVPVKNYSSGMYVRLGFAIAAHSEPEILLVDEVLAVGDVAFQKKCFGFLEENILDKGVTLVLVTHSMYTIARMCRRALVLNRGQTVYLGDSQKAVPVFYKLMREMSPRDALAVDTAGNIREGAGEIRLQSVALIDAEGHERPSITSGEKVEFRLMLRAQRDFRRVPSLTLQLLDTSNTVIAHCGLPGEQQQRFHLHTGDNVVRCTFLIFNLMPGTYTLLVKVGGYGDLLQDNVPNARTIDVIDSDDNVYRSTQGIGMAYLPGQWAID